MNSSVISIRAACRERGLDGWSPDVSRALLGVLNLELGRHFGFDGPSVSLSLSFSSSLSLFRPVVGCGGATTTASRPPHLGLELESAGPSMTSYDGTVKSITGKESGSNFGARSPALFEGSGFDVVVARRTSWVTREEDEGNRFLEEANLGFDLRVVCDRDFDSCCVKGYGSGCGRRRAGRENKADHGELDSVIGCGREREQEAHKR